MVLSATIFTLGTFLFFAFVPLPTAYFPEILTPRPEEFVPAIAFAIALVGFLRKGEWRRDSFEHWLVLALVVNVVAQSVVMPSSAQLYDTSFALAHALKGVSYLLVMIGLLCSMLALFRTAQEGNERIRSVIGNAADGIITIDEQGTMLEFNPAAEQIFHRSADQVIGRNINILMPEPDHSRHDGYLEAYRTTGEPKILREGRTVQGMRADGTEFPMDLAVSQIEIGDQTAFVGIVRDVTERVEREREIQARSAKLEAANADLEAFAYSVSHDLRTPVLSISGLSEHLINDHSDSLDGTGRGFVKRIHAASMNMNGIIDALLKLAHLSTGELVVEEVDVSSLAEEVAESLRVGLTPSPSVRFDITPHLEAQADRRLLRIVLENLLHNSLKYSQQEGTPGHIEMGSETIEGETTFFVRDNGVGFDMDHAKHLFIPFHRVHSSDAFEGTGIGLATVSRIIGRHGGRVWAKAAPGEGATLFFTLGPPPS